jgi:hypothetical protein
MEDILGHLEGLHEVVKIIRKSLSHLGQAFGWR